MNKKIIYLISALLFAHPVAQGFSLSQNNLDTVKSYITTENCFKATFAASVMAFVVYALWNIQGKNHKISVKQPKYQAMPGKLEINPKIKKGILIYINGIYINWINNADQELIEELIDDLQDFCDQHSVDNDTFLTLKNEFVAAFKDENPSKDRIDNAYNALVKCLSIK